jgi:hypothetical protein
MKRGSGDTITVRVAADVRKTLEDWAAANLSNMTTEVNRVVRAYAAKEKEQREGTAGR